MKYLSIAPKAIYSGIEWTDEELSIDDVTYSDLERKHVEIIREFSLSECTLDPEPLTIRVQTEKFGTRMREVHEYFSGLNRGISKKGFRATQALIKDFYVSKNQIIIKSGDEIFGIYELNRSNERYLFGDEYFSSIDWSKIIDLPITQNALIMVSAGSPNWGHYLVDELPRIAMFIGGKTSDEEVNIYLTSYSHLSKNFDVNRMEIVKILFPTRTIHFHFLDQNQVSYFHVANFYSPITFHPFYKNGVLTRLPRSLLDAKTEISTNKPTNKIFCFRRAGSRSTSESDLADLQEIFEPLGFLFYCPEENSVEHQVKTFSDAKFIMGYMGAGMCNSIFTPSGSTVVYIAPNGWEETFFWNLANRLGHGYHVYYSQTKMESDIPEQNTLAVNVQEILDFYGRVCDTL